MAHWSDNPLAVQCEARRVMWRVRDVVATPQAFRGRSCSREGVVRVRGFTLCKRHAVLRVEEIMAREMARPA